MRVGPHAVFHFVGGAVDVDPVHDWRFVGYGAYEPFVGRRGVRVREEVACEGVEGGICWVCLDVNLEFEFKLKINTLGEWGTEVLCYS